MNSFRTVDHNIYCGPYPDSTIRLLLLDLKIKNILCLQTGLFEMFHGKANDEARWGITNKIGITNLELNPFIAPTDDDLRAAVEFIKPFTERVPIYVHCAEGVDRTGMVIAAYRIFKCRWSVDLAIREMMDNGFHRYRYPWWPRRLYALGTL